MRAFAGLSWIAVSLLAARVAMAADSDPRFALAVTVLGDDNGSSFDVSATATPSARWSLSAGGGSSSISGTGGLHGSNFHTSADLHVGNFGVRPGYNHWNDSDDFSSSTPQLALFWQHAGWQAELLAERPKFAIDYQQRVGLQTQARRYQYSGSGFGAGVEYFGVRWGGYLNGVRYSYGDDITRLRTIVQSPNLQRFPRLALLVDSVTTLARGSLRDRWAAGLDRAYSRFSLHADLTRVTDAVTESQAGSYSLGAIFIVNSRLSIDASGGVSHAEGFDDSGFGSLTLSVLW